MDVQPGAHVDQVASKPTFTLAPSESKTAATHQKTVLHRSPNKPPSQNYKRNASAPGMLRELALLTLRSHVAA